jgi:hypothetical protein
LLLLLLLLCVLSRLLLLLLLLLLCFLLPLLLLPHCLDALYEASVLRVRDWSGPVNVCDALLHCQPFSCLARSLQQHTPAAATSAMIGGQCLSSAICRVEVPDV